MKANNLTISIPNKGCEKHCKYCVSECTGSVETNQALMSRNLSKVLNLARMSQVSSVLLTGKGEPCLNFEEVLNFSYMFREFPLELQTNGLWLSKNLNRVQELASNGMNVIAVSMDNTTDDTVIKLEGAVHEVGMLLRVTFNVTNNKLTRSDGSKMPLSFEFLLMLCKAAKVDQLTLRKIVAPNHTKETEQSKWIKENCDPSLYVRLVEEMKEMCQKDGHHLRTLPYGAEVYDLQGVAVSYSNYCIQDDNNTEDIRSLIFQEDGHVYSSWNSKASILF